MLTARIFGIGILYSVAKGALLSVAMSLLNIQFIDQLIIALVSSFIGLFGVILGTRLAAKEARENRDRLEPPIRDIQRKIGADQREHDTL